MDFCKKSLAGYKVPKSIDFVDELPKNPTGKILKRVMREQYLEKSK
jgi:acyl-CoA synthetase (AMP-forming)/AMP-acid ligase II